MGVAFVFLIYIFAVAVVAIPSGLVGAGVGRFMARRAATTVRHRYRWYDAVVVVALFLLVWSCWFGCIARGGGC